jgi:hypothetical protein
MDLLDSLNSALQFSIQQTSNFNIIISTLIQKDSQVGDHYIGRNKDKSLFYLNVKLILAAYMYLDHL